MKVCIACGRDIDGRPVELRPADPKYALCRDCNNAPSQRVVPDQSDDARSRPLGAESTTTQRADNAATATAESCQSDGCVSS